MPATASLSQNRCSDDILMLDVEKRIEVAIKHYTTTPSDFKIAVKVSQYYVIPYRRFKSRLSGHHPKSGNRTGHAKLTEREELALHAWINLHISVGISVTTERLCVTTNWLLRVNASEERATKRWAQRYMRRHTSLFHSIKTKSKATVRKAVGDKKETIQGLFDTFKQVARDDDVFTRNTWNGDKSEYRVGSHNQGHYVWIYTDIPIVFHSDPEIRTLITVVGAISAAGEKIPPFIVMAGKEIKNKHIDNSLENECLISTSRSGYIDD
ncbi:hypothetical protein GGS21DRAFT_503723 [Xylaria nigripes]|nr:hypothetical protein GGS21DRAFT_503723 [Xylaria nigripes]